MQHVFASWSGGKDSCLATCYALEWGLEVRFLLTMMDGESPHSWVHRLPLGILQAQSTALGIPLVAARSSMPTYEADFKEIIAAFKPEGVTGGVFGDMDIEEHRQWVERVCREAGAYAHLPLWKRDQQEVLRDFINLGFEAVVVATRGDVMGEEWLGRRIDKKFLADLEELRKTRPVTWCGEEGEYHTCVLDGPLFRQGIEIKRAQNVRRDGYWFLEIEDWALRAKG